jgi:hypothetical protein
MPAGNIESLPKWAQGRIRDLEGQVELLSRKLITATADPNAPRDNIHVEIHSPGARLPDYVALPHRRARFFLGNDRWDYIDVNVLRTYMDGNQNVPVLDVMGYRALRFHPRSSNAGYLTMEKR